ncbi:HAD family hydrolase [Gulosibacter molinativorax]|uniref:HAD family hydrolase n=1 Tax=Gulosibacter molinativorax TaxID=256821 RepID=A0ABT7C692_9MICO|nr:HAD family hydrolase [Gulosibacter molinativorax]MDJ1370689.1 HAD family hydrolase [Gulosibacter molinativorax]QUY63284.1 Hydrolase [Gulosibacter molinativorax]
MTATIIFDFDGTVAVGNGPVLAYARFVAEVIGPGYLDAVAEVLQRHDLGAGRYRDGYDVVGSLARDRGVEEGVLNSAYALSRDILGKEEAAVEPAPGLITLLDSLDPSIHLELATNAPNSGVLELLDRWGIREKFSRLHFSVGKPSGLEPILRDALSRGPVLSIGDIYEFDLAPAAALGADTAFLGANATDRLPGEAAPTSTMRAHDLATLVPSIQTWATAALAQRPN